MYTFGTGLMGTQLNGYLVLQGKIPLRTSQLRHVLKLPARKKAGYPLGKVPVQPVPKGWGPTHIIHIYIYIYIERERYVMIYILCMYVYIYIYIYICTYVHTCMHTYIHTYKYIYNVIQLLCVIVRCSAGADIYADPTQPPEWLRLSL